MIATEVIDTPNYEPGHEPRCEFQDRGDRELQNRRLLSAFPATERFWQCKLGGFCTGQQWRYRSQRLKRVLLLFGPRNIVLRGQTIPMGRECCPQQFAAPAFGLSPSSQPSDTSLNCQDRKNGYDRRWHQRKHGAKDVSCKEGGGCRRSRAFRWRFLYDRLQAKVNRVKTFVPRCAPIEAA